MSTRATALFDVTGWDPAAFEEPEAGPQIARIGIRKAYRGDLEGEGTGEGLFFGMNGPAAGAGYVVSERFTGKLGGLEGTFVLHHVGVAEPGAAPRSFGHVVPGSGTGALASLRGEVSFHPDHTVTLDYHFAEVPFS
jgi:hypothetical protein